MSSGAVTGRVARARAFRYNWINGYVLKPRVMTPVRIYSIPITYYIIDTDRCDLLC